MLDIPISVVAWMSVVVVQAIVHYVVLGARHERIQQKQEESLVLEESLTLMSASEEEEAIEPTNGFTTLPESPTTPSKLNASNNPEDEMIETTQTEKFMQFLTQTGSELFKSRSVECMVNEQIRARPQ